MSSYLFAPPNLVQFKSIDKKGKTIGFHLNKVNTQEEKWNKTQKKNKREKRMQKEKEEKICWLKCISVYQMMKIALY